MNVFTVLCRGQITEQSYNDGPTHCLIITKRNHTICLKYIHSQCHHFIKCYQNHAPAALSKTTACAMPVKVKWYAYYCAHVSSARNTTTPPINVFGRCTISLPIATTTKPASMPAQLHLYQVNIIFKFLIPCFTMSFVRALTFHGHCARLFLFCCNSLHRPASFPLSFVGRTPSMRNVFRKRLSFKPLVATCSLPVFTPVDSPHLVAPRITSSPRDICQFCRDLNKRQLNRARCVGQKRLWSYIIIV